MAYVLGTHTSVGATGGANVSTGAIDTSGMSLVVLVVNYYTTDAPVIADSKSNVLTALTAQANAAGSDTCRLYYIANPTVGSGHTFTATSGGGGGFASMCVASFSGASLSSPLDQQNGAADVGSVTTLQPGSITPTQDAELVITGFGMVGTTASINGGFTISDQVAHSGGNHFGSALAYLIQTTATAANPTWTSSDANPQIAVIASFKIPGTGGYLGRGGSLTHSALIRNGRLV